MSETAFTEKRGWRKIKHPRLIALVGTAALIGAAAYGFTAANTVPTSSVGAGSGVASGYVVSNIHYTLNATTPQNVDSLTFTVAPTIPSAGTGTVITQIALSAGGPVAYTCTGNATGETVTCVTTSPLLLADKVVGVTVVAAQ